MARRRLTIKRLDPWSVLKFSILAHLVGFAILMLIAGVVYYIIDQLQLIDQACGIAADVGFTSCGINTSNLFRALALLGAMGVVVATAVSVFVAFLYNLIADLTGGLTIGVVDDAPPTRAAANAPRPDHGGAVPMDRAVTTGRRDAVVAPGQASGPRASGPDAGDGRNSHAASPQTSRWDDPDRSAVEDEASHTQRHDPVGRRRPQDGDELFR